MLKSLKERLNTTTLLWLLRQVLQFGGMWLVANGHATQAEWDAITGAIATLGDPAVIGAASLLVGFAGNVWASFRPKVTLPSGEAVGLKKVEERSPSTADFLRSLGKK